jgi:Cof subfamily protein (haloacid dehalogenase superfamily)
MTRIALVVSDIDGTLLTHDKTLTDGAKAAVRRLHQAGIGFTLTSSRPTIGMRFLIAPLSIALPIGAFNGSSIVDPHLKPVEQHFIPAPIAARSLAVLDEFGVDSWLFTNESWLVRRPDGAYVTHEAHAIKADPTIVSDFTPYLTSICKIVGASADPASLQACEAAMQKAVGTQATAVRSQSYYLDVTAPDCDKGTFVQWIANRLNISTDAVATIGDMENDLPMFRTSGLSIAMGNASDAIQKKATFVTASNEDEGFAKAVEMILKRNEN